MEDTQQRQKLSLVTIQGGALVEQFDRALDKTFENLGDINTTIKPREIRLVVQIKPNDDRTFLEIVGAVSTRLASQEAIKTTADLTTDDRGRAVAYNRRRKQLEMPFNVTRLNQGGADQ
jgi:hypothetical protein